MAIQIFNLLLHFISVVGRESWTFVEILATVLSVVFLHEHLRKFHFLVVHRIKLLTYSLEVFLKRMVITDQPLQVARLVFKLGF